MVERLARIGRAVVDVFDIDRGRAEKQKPKPLSLDERDRLEKYCQVLLGNDSFGRADFGGFCENMIDIVRQDGDPKGFARLRDQKAECFIQFNKDEIWIRGDLAATDDPHVFEEVFFEHISYSAQKRGYSLFGDTYSDFQPIVTTHDNVPVSESIEYFSYISGKSESAFPKGTHPVRTEKKVSDKDVQAFCKRVYAVYSLNKAGANFPPQ